MYVFDATPLISLASIDRLSLVTALDGECCLPERVSDEVVTAGLDAGHADARRIEQAINDDRLSVVPDPETPLAAQLARSDRLSGADVAVLALAAERNGTAVMDEAYGRMIAETEGIPTRGTAYVVLYAQRQGEIDATDAQATIAALLDAGWYCAPDLYAQILERIDEIG